MQIVRTVVWMLLLFGILVFSWANWDEDVTVRIWSGLFWETKLPAVIIVSFMVGFLPMWLLNRGASWRANRRIANLENAVRSAATPTPSPTPVAVDAEPTPLASDASENPQTAA